ncbi:MAG: potassium transporter KefC [Xanthomonadales bacterium]|nr:monovalent cation:proton antiporter-2 (CPA2) family protein [Gammaproteobacteria bacterium]MBT8054545.1 monovalent cation:proton antiporter-2 (CPA2) family protein [Gammaproteobacteria bacterium]NND57615.1 potassium transporter KefC [Xanthomonadales bacterium]NNK51339.1 potassium transporter KefC [Xanthomonadales bacterium]NNL94220.1 potassium transporter KefC [Xanthomonadales bacterium]
MVSAYLYDIVILLLAAVVLVPLFQAMRLGAVPGFLVAGILVGPGGFGLIDKVEEIVHLAEIGVVLLLFVIGIELKPSRLWLMRRMVFGLGSSQVLLTGAILATIAYFFFGLSMQTAVLLGTALALSSTAMVLQILSEQRALMTTYGRGSFAVLLMQDLAVVPLLAMVPLLANSAAGGEIGLGGSVLIALLESMAIVGLVVVTGRYLLHPILHRVAKTGNPEIFTATAVLIVLGAALASDRAGLSMAMGAFLAGLLISESAFRHQVIAEIEPFRGLLLGLFFMSMGLLFNFEPLLQHPLEMLALVVSLLALKIAILLPLARLFRLETRQAFAVALLLAQSGEFALVAFALARQAGLLDAGLFQNLLPIVLLSMLMTPFLAMAARHIAGYRPRTGGDENAAHENTTPENAPVVIAGYGRVGRRVGEILARADQPFVAVDSDSALVSRERKLDNPVYYGNVTQAGLLRSLGAGGAKIIVVTLNDPEATTRLVSTLKEQYPDVAILARGHNLEICQDLVRMGSAGVVSENVEASLELSRMVMELMGGSDAQQEEVLNSFRRHYHEQIYQVHFDKTTP